MDYLAMQRLQSIETCQKITLAAIFIEISLECYFAESIFADVRSKVKIINTPNKCSM